MDKERLKKSAIGLGRDLFLAFVVVVVIMLILYAYCRVWPPMVVVESGSMEHSQTRSYVGVIDTGDMIFVKKINDRNDLISYVEGEAVDYSKYGCFGDVVIYRPNGDGNRTPIIHRLVVWLEVNETRVMPQIDGIVDYDNYTFDVPSLGIFDAKDDVTLHDYGHDYRTVAFNLTSVLRTYEINDVAPHAGFITLGDANSGVDQISYLPVKVEWVVGKAVGELPWFGLIKLGLFGGGDGAHRNSWVNLFVTITVLLCIPLFLDFGLPFIKKKLKRGRAKEPGAPETEEGPPDRVPAAEPGPAPKEDDAEKEKKRDASETEEGPHDESPTEATESKQEGELPEKDAHEDSDAEPTVDVVKEKETTRP